MRYSWRLFARFGLAWLSALVLAASGAFPVPAGDEDAPPVTAAAADVERLLLDRSIEGVLSPDDPDFESRGCSRRYALDPSASGVVTIALDSYDFDARVTVLDAGGEKVVLTNEARGGPQQGERASA